MRTAFVITLIASLFAAPAHAWHAQGHRLTAQIAFDRMTSEQQRHVANILRAHPRFREDFRAQMPDAIANGSASEQGRWLFAHASNWPDQVDDLSASLREQYHRSTWHYINLPVFLTPDDKAELAGELDQNVSLLFTPPLRPGMNLIQALTGNLKEWRDNSASNAEKAIALCWILHLVGDMHEPLHNVALFSADYFPRGDLGGNVIGIRRSKENTNLHVVWDGLANDIFSLTADDATTRFLANDVVDIDAIPAWSQQYRELAAERVYTDELRRRILALPRGTDEILIDLPKNYVSNAKTIAKSQIVVAGHRIAALLEN